MLQICHCVQLNALFCCLWRNVEASCHKHFVVFSRNQHRCLPPAMCHNLRDGGRPPATAFTTPACCSVNTGSQARYSSESWFLPTPPAFDVPVWILLCHLAALAWKTRMAWLPDSEKILMICLFVLTWSTNRGTPHDDTGRACMASRSKNWGFP